MLKTRNKKSKNIFFSLILCIAMTISAFTGLHFIKQDNVMAAGSDYIQKDVSSDLLSTYYNFYTTSSAKPATPNGWTEISDNQVNKDNIIKGIVDLKDETTFKTSTYHTTKPTMPQDESSDTSYFKNLMINSYSGSGRFGYKSNSISLEANSYYEIRVKLYTHRTEASGTYKETDPYASIYLSNLTDDEEYKNQVKFENINTLKTWTTYSFFIDTNESASVNLELWLGSKTSICQGAVFFNKVQIIRYSESYYSEYVRTKNDTDTDNFNIISLSKDQNLSPVTNSGFETSTPFGWNRIASSTTKSENQLCQIVDNKNYKLVVDEQTTITAPGSNYSANNNLCLFMYNKNDGYQAIESSKINIEPLSYYKISFFAKSDCNVGNGATVMLVDKSEEDAIDSASITLATKYTKNNNIYRNDWTEYSFYVYGDKLETKQVAIQIWLGTNSSKTSGYVFIDDFRMEEVSYNTFSNNSSSSNSSALNFNSDSDLFVVTNSTFDKTSNEENTKVYPLAPSDWTKEGKTNSYTFSGVINTSEEHFNANIDKYKTPYSAINPSRPTGNPNGDDNNVLMIGSATENATQTYKSSSLTLNASSYYKLSYYVYTDYNKSNKNNYGASVSLKTSTKTLYEYQNIHFTDSNWHQFVVYIKTGVSSESATINLTFQNLTGYVYFDDVRLETSSETVYNNFMTFPEIVYTKVDLSYENFDNRTYNTDNTQLQTPNNWTASEQGVNDGNFTIAQNGIVNLGNYANIDVHSTLSSNPNALLIQSLHDTNFAYTTNDSYSFTAETYYKITVNVLTDNLQANIDDEYVINPDNRGARISLDSSSEILIANINTAGGWKTYTIYLSLETDLTSKISLALGNTDEKVSGTVLFDNLKIETIDFDTMKTELTTVDESTTARFINYVEDTDDGDDDSSTWSNDFDWLILPSLLTALAIIIAVVGFYVRKIRINRKPKIKTKYDRRKTLDKDIDRREKIALRQQIIDELNAELIAIDKEIAEYTLLAEAQLEELRNQIITEKEAIKRQKLEIEIRKKEATAEREKQLKANPELVSNTKAEKEYVKFMEKLDKQEMHLQKQLALKDVKLENIKEADKTKLAKFLERKEFIKNEIAKIEAEIESIAKEEAEMWEEYKLAKAEAKQKKAELKAQAKENKSNNKNKTTNKTTTNTTKTDKKTDKSTNKQEKTQAKADNKSDDNTTKVDNQSDDNKSSN